MCQINVLIFPRFSSLQVSELMPQRMKNPGIIPETSAILTVLFAEGSTMRLKVCNIYTQRKCTIKSMFKIFIFHDIRES